MAQKKIPARQCIGCMTSRPKKELVRVVRAPSGEITSRTRRQEPAAVLTPCPDRACHAKGKKKSAGALLEQRSRRGIRCTGPAAGQCGSRKGGRPRWQRSITPRKTGLEPNEALFQAVSLCRKAGALTMGFDAVEDAVVKGKAWLVMTASDASPKTVQRLNYAVGDMVDVIPMPLTQDKLADISRKPVAIYAVTDRNLAKL